MMHPFGNSRELSCGDGMFLASDFSDRVALKNEDALVAIVLVERN
jgi:hypothetical protein